MKTIPTTIVAAIILTFTGSAVAGPVFKGGRGYSIQRTAQVQKSLKSEFVPISLIKKITRIQSPQNSRGNKSFGVIRGGRGKR